MTAAIEHRFGGPWTEVKLDAVQYYLNCYSKALGNRRFDLWYVDAFAGTGERTEERIAGGLFAEEGPARRRIETLAGSARRALEVAPGFDHFVFIEQDPGHCEALKALKRNYPDRDIQIVTGDANVVLKEMTSGAPWSRRDRGPARGIVFLDPYALQVEWSTLVALAGTRVLDVWYLFPLQAVLRNLAHDHSRIGSKKQRLDLVLGPEWRELYRLKQTDGLFRDRETELRRDATAREVEAWFHRRLKSIFPYASEPLPILKTRRKQMFSLFLAVSNPGRPAIDLAQRFAMHVNKKYGPAALLREFRL
jgi:three-Cys-motif partner protein